MASIDQMSNINPKMGLAPLAAAITDTTVQKTGAIDTLGYNSCTFIIATGILADVDATFTVVLKEGDDATQTNHTAVVAAGILGSNALAGFTFANDGACFKIGYIGAKRYCSLEITPVANTGAAPLAVIALLGNPGSAPTANPPS